MEGPLRYEETTFSIGIQTTGTGNHRACGTKNPDALTFKLAKSMGAGQVSTKAIDEFINMKKSKRRIYLAQFSIVNEGQYVLLPYSAGLLWAYARNLQEIVQEYELASDIFFVPEPIENIVERITDPSVFGVSTYVWNANYSDRLASAVKQRYPDCLVIYGGPQVPDNAVDMMIEKTWIDICVHQEGEIVFSEVLKEHLLARDWSRVSGITYRPTNREAAPVKTMAKQRIGDLDSVISPYLDGVFDGYTERYSKWTINAVFESSRGCPFKCTFCDWGSATFTKLRKFGTQRVSDEIRWMGENKIDCVVNADANFGIFKEKDAETADHLVRTKSELGWPKLFNTNWTKSNNSVAINIAAKLQEAGMLRKFVISLQSLNDETLRFIERNNMKLNNFDQIMELAKEKDISVMIELIMNLPGETYESWTENYCRLLKYENIFIESYPLQLLTNSEMNKPEYRKKYGLKTAWVTLPTSQGVTKYVEEKEEIVIATSTMDEQESKRAWLFSWFVKVMHSQGFLFFVADYLIKKLKISHGEFYREVFDQMLCSDGVLRETYDVQVERFSNRSLSDFYFDNRWVEVLGQKRRQEFYLEAKQIVARSFSVPELDELFRFQNLASLNPNISYPVVNEFGLDYLQATGKSATYSFSHPGIGNHESYKSYIALSRSTRWKVHVELVK